MSIQSAWDGFDRVKAREELVAEATIAATMGRRNVQSSFESLVGVKILLEAMIGLVVATLKGQGGCNSRRENRHGMAETTASSPRVHTPKYRPIL